MSEPIALNSQTLADLDRLAQAIVQGMPSHLVIGMVGTLGAGKTTLTQALARAAGVDSSEVTSPTFTLLQTYRGRPKIHHLDAYRVANEDEFLELGVDELLEDPDAWTIVEWADRVADVMPDETVWLRLEIESDDLRTLNIQCNDQSLTRQLVEITGAR